VSRQILVRAGLLPVLASAFVATLFLQALLLPIAAGQTDVSARAAAIGAGSWRGLAIFVLLIGVMGYWAFAGAPTAGSFGRGKITIYIGTLLGTLPLWAFMNGLLGYHITDLIPLWLMPISVLVAGAAMSKDWKDMIKALVIGFGIPVASLFFLATFVDFGN
jgi:hypothetical protein